MIKGTKCENCGEEIYCEALVLEFEGQRFYFHDRECIMQWLWDKVKPFLFWDDTIEEY